MAHPGVCGVLAIGEPFTVRSGLGPPLKWVVLCVDVEKPLPTLPLST